MPRALFSLLLLIGLATNLFAQPEPPQNILDVVGKPSGKITKYDSLGRVLTIAKYKRGVLQGPAEYYYEGKLFIATSYKKGKENGVQRRYDINSGRLTVEMEVKDDHRNGFHKQYEWIGDKQRLYMLRHYRNDSLYGTSETFNTDGSYLLNNYINEVPDGLQKSIISSRTVLTYFTRGVVDSVKEYVRGKLVSQEHKVGNEVHIQRYYSNGRIKSLTVRDSSYSHYQTIRYFLPDGRVVMNDSAGIGVLNNPDGHMVMHTYRHGDTLYSYFPKKHYVETSKWLKEYDTTGNLLQSTDYVSSNYYVNYIRNYAEDGVLSESYIISISNKWTDTVWDKSGQVLSVSFNPPMLSPQDTALRTIQSKYNIPDSAGEVQPHVVKDNLACLYGLKDSKGKIVLPLSYNSIVPDGYWFRLMNDNKYGYADYKGKVILPPAYDEPPQLYDNKWWVVVRDRQLAVLDLKGNALLPYQPHSRHLWLYNKYLLVWQDEATIRVYNNQLKLIIPNKYNFIGRSPLPGYFVVTKSRNQSMDSLLFGIVDSTGKEIFAPRFDTIFPNSFSANSFMAATGKSIGIYSLDGRQLVKELHPVIYMQPYSIYTGYYDQPYIETDFLPVREKTGFGIIDKTGKLVLAAEYDTVRYVYYEHDTLWQVIKNGKTGIYNTTKGFFTLPLMYDSIMDIPIRGTETSIYTKFYNEQPHDWTVGHMYLAKLNGLWGMLKYNGEIVLPHKYSGAAFSSEGGVTRIMLTDKDSVYGFVLNEELSRIDALEENWGIKFNHGRLAYFVLNGNNIGGLIDNSGKIIVPLQYNIQLDHGIFMVREADSLIAMYRQDNGVSLPVSPFHQHLLQLMDNGWAIVTDSTHKCGLIDASGKVVLPIIYRGMMDLNYDEGRVWVQTSSEVDVLAPSENEENPEGTENAENAQEVDYYQETLVREYGKWQVYDTLGNLLSTDTFYHPFKLADAPSAIAETPSELFGVIGANYQWIIQPIYDEIDTMRGYWKLTKSTSNINGNSEWLEGLADSTGKMVIANLYDEIMVTDSNYFVVKKDYQLGLLDKNANWIVPLDTESFFHSNLYLDSLIGWPLQSDINGNTINFEVLDSMDVSVQYKVLNYMLNKLLLSNGSHNHEDWFADGNYITAIAIESSSGYWGGGSYSEDYTPRLIGATDRTISVVLSIVNCENSGHGPGYCHSNISYSSYYFDGDSTRQIFWNDVVKMPDVILNAYLQEALSKLEDVTYSCSDNEKLADLVSGHEVYNKESVDFYLDLSNHDNEAWAMSGENDDVLTLTIPYAQISKYVVKDSWLEKLIKSQNAK